MKEKISGYLSRLLNPDPVWAPPLHFYGDFGTPFYKQEWFIKNLSESRAVKGLKVIFDRSLEKVVDPLLEKLSKSERMS